MSQGEAIALAYVITCYVLWYLVGPCICLRMGFQDECSDKEDFWLPFMGVGLLAPASVPLAAVFGLGWLYIRLYAQPAGEYVASLDFSRPKRRRDESVDEYVSRWRARQKTQEEEYLRAAEEAEREQAAK